MPAGAWQVAESQCSGGGVLSGWESAAHGSGGSRVRDTAGMTGLPTRFPFRLGRRSRPILRIFGVRDADDAYVRLDGDRFTARFGRFELDTPIANIVGWRIEGPWRWITAIGVRMSIRHGDITFGGSHRGGVRVDFRESPPLWRFHPRALYVTVEDLEGLASALAERGIPGEDARHR